MKRIGFGFFVDDKLYKGKIFPTKEQAIAEAKSYRRWEEFKCFRICFGNPFNEPFEADIREIFTKKIEDIK